MNDKKLSLIEKLMANAGINKVEKSIEIDVSKSKNESEEFPKIVWTKREYTSEDRKRLQKARSLLQETKEGLDFFKKELKGTGLSNNVNVFELNSNYKKIAEEIERIKRSLFQHKFINKDGSEFKNESEAIEKSVEANA